MKIALVHNLPAGGQKRALYEQVKRLSKKHTIDLFTLSCTDESFLPLHPFVQHHYTAPYTYPAHFPSSVASIYLQLPKAYQELAQKINEGGYDIVYVNPCFLTQAPLVLQYLKIPSVYYCCEPKREFYEEIPRVSNSLTYTITYPFRYPIQWMEQKSARMATTIITCGLFAAQQITRAYGKNPQINRLGVDTKMFHPVNTTKENMVITVGDMSLLKGHDFLIRAVSKIESSTRPKLVIVGHGGVEKKYYHKLAKDAGVELAVRENVSDEDLIGLYSQAKCFVYAPIREPFGLVVLEAAACGLPVVAIDEGGPGEILHDGILGKAVPCEAKLFADAIEGAITTKKDTKKIHQYLEKHWNWDESVKGLEKLLQNTSKGLDSRLRGNDGGRE